MSIRIGIYGYGNLGKGVECAIKDIQAGERCALFFNGQEINRWNYNESVVSWSKNRMYLINDSLQQKIFAVYDIPTQITSSDKNKMNMSSRGNKWQRINNPLGDLFPIAQVGGKLYFTDKKEYSVLNGIWASGYVYSVDYDPIVLNELNVVEIGDEHYTFKDNNVKRKSDCLFDELYNNYIFYLYQKNVVQYKRKLSTRKLKKMLSKLNYQC